MIWSPSLAPCPLCYCMNMHETPTSHTCHYYTVRSQPYLGSFIFLQERLLWSFSFIVGRVGWEIWLPFYTFGKTGEAHQCPWKWSHVGSYFCLVSREAEYSLLEDHPGLIKINYHCHWETSQVSYSDRWFKLQIIKFQAGSFSPLDPMGYNWGESLNSPWLVMLLYCGTKAKHLE